MNAGVILTSGTTVAQAIALFRGGYVSNAATGTISATGGGGGGVYITGAAGTVVNDGKIYANGLHGPVVMEDGGTVVNQSAGTISTPINPDIAILGGPGTVINFGLILNPSSAHTAIDLFAGGYLSNAATGTISSYNHSNIYGTGGAVGVVNAGVMLATNITVLTFETGATVTNKSTGTISGVSDINIKGAAGTVVNAGKLLSSGAAQIYFGDGGTVTNLSTGTIIASAGRGVYAIGGSSTLINAGDIQSAGAGPGVEFKGGTSAAVTNQSTGTISATGIGVYLLGVPGPVINAGLITAGSIGVISNSDDIGTVVNTGTIAGTADGIIFDSDGTLVDAGLVVGGQYAVRLASAGTSRLVVDPGAAFIGTVSGDNPRISTLELASGASTGTLSGLGTKYIDFGQVAIDSHAIWQVSGTNYLATGTTLTNAGMLTLSGTVSGGGEVVIDSGATLALAGTLGAAESTLLMGDEVILAGDLPGDTDLMPDGTIDVAYLNFASGGSASVNPVTNVLTVSVGGDIYTQQLSGAYAGDEFDLEPDAGGGTEVTMDVAVQGNTVTVAPVSGQVLSLDQLIANPTVAPTGTIQSLVFNGPGTATVSGIVSINTLEVSEGLLALSGGTVDTDPVTIGPNGDISGYGTVTGAVTNAGTVTATGGRLELTGSVTGVGILAVDPGATLLLDLGGSAGAVTVNSGALAAAGDLNVGQAGLGGLLVENQATATIGTTAIGGVQGLDIGPAAGEAGDAVVTGSGSLLDNAGALIVGDTALGSLSIEAGGTVITVPVLADAAVIGNAADASGSSVNVSGSGSNWQVGGTLVIGDAASGALDISSGGSVSAASLDAGVLTNSSGVLTVSDTGSTLTTAGSLTIGDGGAGELSILNGASVTVGGDLDVGQSAKGSGNVDIENASLSVSGNLDLGLGGGAGVLTIGTGATLQVSGGEIGGPDSELNEFGDPSSTFDDGVNTNVGASETQEFTAYIDDFASFTIDAGVTLTLDTPSIYDDVAFTLGGRRDTTGDELILNAGSVSADTTVTFSNAHGTLVLGTDSLGTIDIQANDTAAATLVANPDLGVPTVAQFYATVDDYKAGDQIVVDTDGAATFQQNGSVIEVVQNTTTIAL